MKKQLTRIARRSAILSLALAAAFSFGDSSSANAEAVTAMTNAEIRLATGSSTDDDSGIRVFSGATSTLFFNVEGSGVSPFSVLAVADFQMSATPLATGFANTSLSLFEDPAGFAAAGDIEVYLLNDTSANLIDATSNPVGSPAYQDGNDGFAAIDPVFNPSATPLGIATFTPTTVDGTETNVALNFTGSDSTTLLSAIQTGGVIRLAVVSSASTPNVAATFAGQGNSAGPAPTFNFDVVTAIPEPSSAFALALTMTTGIVVRRRRK
ncbi:PEP-CTERM sorting domain-containing protein [Stieleria sp. JC731]|uniref:PEP-CTERM sorting domain-containing protein n=1 Tax=Pirellulaceae TaxID=2691357 RepID=UPI001E48A3CC|nr:PEP-CTERM sorting domain-containing protein [Stieleria sp. JC731]MCC9601901.1 PEP-CTERM sorting domain-containing protein [Stieleria sp. JC731]